MVIVYAIIMSLWTQYGGMNNYEKAGQIDAYSITVNKLNLKYLWDQHFIKDSNIWLKIKLIIELQVHVH